MLHDFFVKSVAIDVLKCILCDLSKLPLHNHTGVYLRESLCSRRLSLPRNGTWVSLPSLSHQEPPAGPIPGCPDPPSLAYPAALTLSAWPLAPAAPPMIPFLHTPPPLRGYLVTSRLRGPHELSDTLPAPGASVLGNKLCGHDEAEAERSLSSRSQPTYGGLPGSEWSKDH